MNAPEIDEAWFLKDVANHLMEINRDDGLYRHLRFSQPDTCCYWFDVVTWPGILCYQGDMGCYMFRRIPDMLEFFRDGTAGPLRINPHYWSQKAKAIGRNSPIEEFDPDQFRKRIEEWLDESEASPKLREAVKVEVLSRADDGEREAMRAAIDFEHGGFRFQDFWEVDLKRYSHRFLWCCYALAWAVRQYDAAKASTEKEIAI